MTRRFGMRVVTIGFRLTMAVALGLVLAPTAVAAPAGTSWWPANGSVLWLDRLPGSMERLVLAESLEVPSVPAALALAVAKETSDFGRDLIGATGFLGVMQLRPTTVAREFGVTPHELQDPVTNVRLGLHYLSRLHWRYDGNWELALSHYRGGPLPSRAGRDMPHEHTRGFVDRVMRWWWRYERSLMARDQVPDRRPVPRFINRFSAHGFPGLSTEPPIHSPWLGSWVPITGERLR